MGARKESNGRPKEMDSKKRRRRRVKNRRERERDRERKKKRDSGQSVGKERKEGKKRAKTKQ